MSQAERPMRVVVVDDSSFVRRAITRMLEDDPRIEIVGQAATGEELVTHLEAWAPDAITLDLSMPGMGGLQTLDHIMAHRPTPVVILSTHSAKDAPMTIEALHRGATDFIDKQQYSLVDFDALRKVIVSKLLLLRGIKTQAVAQTRAPSQGQPAATLEAPRRHRARAAGSVGQGPPGPNRRRASASGFELLVVGASTGGPPTIQRLLEDLGAGVDVPVLVVQHMPRGFTSAFAERLNAHLPLQVREVNDGEVLQPATVYIAAAGMHVRVERSAERLIARLDTEPSAVSHRPSVDVLFASAARVVGRRCLAVLLTGMGTDGAQGMLDIHRAGGHTLGQDADSCIVYGMPRAAANLRALSEEVPLSKLGARLRKLLAEPARGEG